MVKRFNGVALFFFIFTNIAIPQPKYRFDRLSLEEGLSQSTVFSIAQDRRGFMWFGTTNGLNRYDGYHFKIYLHDPLDRNSLSNDYIHTVYVDRKNRLWVGTNCGLNLYDDINDRFIRIANDSSNALHVSGDVISDIYETKDGCLWIATNVGLNKLDPDNSESKYYACASVSAVYEDESGILWLGTFGRGVLQFDRRGKQVLNATKWNSGKSDVLNTMINVIFEDSRNNLWFGTSHIGLSFYDRKSGIFKTYANDPADPKSLVGNNVWTILEDRPGILWVGTDAGLDKFVVTTEKCEHVLYEPGNSESLSTNRVSSLWRDRSGIFWVGTVLGGINKLVPSKNDFAHYSYNPLNSKSLHDNPVYSFHQDFENNIWIGTWGGLNKFYREKNRFEYLRPSTSGPTTFQNVVLSLNEDQEHNIWFGTWGSGLYRLTPDSVLNQYRYNVDPSRGLQSNVIWSILPDHDKLWLATSAALTLMHSGQDYEAPRFRHYRHNQANRFSLSHNGVRTVYKDSGGNLWVGTEGGLNRMDAKFLSDPVPISPQDVSFFRYLHDDSTGTGLSHNVINSIYEDRDGYIWVATYGGGLNRIDIHSEEIRWYTQRDGLPNNVVYGILPDERGHLWLSTNKGLSRFTLQDGTFRNFDMSDGLQSNEFNTGAYYRNQKGEMFFGGINGFNIFHPDSIDEGRTIPNIAITAFTILGEPALTRLSTAGKGGIPLKLRHDERFFSFEFAVLDYANPKQNEYAYKLEGFDEKWNYCGTRRYAGYTNLNPGKYVFRLKGANSYGTWNDQGVSVELIVAPPFWQTSGFYIGSSLLLFSLIGWAYQYRVRMKLREMKITETIRKKAAADFHDELGHQLTKLSLFVELTRQHLNGHSPEIIKYLQKIGDTSNNLANSVRDFLWALEPGNDTFYEVAIRLKDFGDDLFDNSGTTFRAKGLDSDLMTYVVPMIHKRQIILIFKEAMNNALKHARCNNVQLAFFHKEGKLSISVHDDGIGFHDANGSGSGFSNMRSRAEGINCRLNIISSVGVGTTITFEGRSKNGRK